MPNFAAEDALVKTTFTCGYCYNHFTLLHGKPLFATICPKCDKTIRPAFWSFSPETFFALNIERIFRVMPDQVRDAWQIKNDDVIEIPPPPIPPMSQKFRPVPPGQPGKRNTALLRKRIRDHTKKKGK